MKNAMTVQEAFNVVCDGSYLGLTRYERIVQDAEFYRRSAVAVEVIALRIYLEMRKAGSKSCYRPTRQAIRSIYLQYKKARKH